MDKFIIVRTNDKGMPEFLRELHSDDSYTDDIGCAMVFETEGKALRERIDDEFVAVLVFDKEERIIGYEAEHEGYREASYG